MNNLSFNETFRYRVKQMDEFMKRFNGIESIPLPLEDSLKRCTNMLYLFDSELFRNNPDSVKNAQSVLTRRKNAITVDGRCFF